MPNITLLTLIRIELIFKTVLGLNISLGTCVGGVQIIRALASCTDESRVEKEFILIIIYTVFLSFEFHAHVLMIEVFFVF